MHLFAQFVEHLVAGLVHLDCGPANVDFPFRVSPVSFGLRDNEILELLSGYSPVFICVKFFKDVLHLFLEQLVIN